MLPRLELDFSPATRVSRKAVGAFSLALLGLLVSTVCYLDVQQTVTAKKSVKKIREISEISANPHPRRSSEEIRFLQQEVKAVNRQIRQLNHSWDRLLVDLSSYPGEKVHILALEVDAISGSIRLMAIAPSVEVMTDFSGYLADKKSFTGVVLSRHEIENGRMRFVVDRKWAEKL